VVSTLDPAAQALRQTLVQEFANIPGVVGVTSASDSLPQQGHSAEMATMGEISLSADQLLIAPDFFQLYAVTPLAGRLFSIDRRGDFRAPLADADGLVGQSVIVNASFVKKAGFATPEEALGQQIKTHIASHAQAVVATIVGVVSDMHTRSVRSAVNPMIFFVEEDPLGLMTLDIRSDNLSATLTAVDAVWQGLVPGVPIKRSFVDENIDALYRSEEERGRMFAVFSLFAVLVASLGLYGLAAFTAERRTLEIGVRKVMGAGVFDIVKLLTWQFSKPVLIASAIGIAVAWPMMADWLSGFRYRIDLIENAYLFVVAAAIALIIASVTVAGHAYRAARANPVQSLRYE